MADLPAGWVEKLSQFLDGFLPVLDEVDTPALVVDLDAFEVVGVRTCDEGASLHRMVPRSA